jgi:hypothetical protein
MKIRLLVLLLFLSAVALHAQNTRINECVVANGELTTVQLDYNTGTGEKTIMVNGSRKKFDDLYPLEGAGYAATRTWYLNNEKITYKGRPYAKYGLPRVLGVSEVKKTGTKDDVNIYADPAGDAIASVIYLPVRRGCEFQPYQLVCGELSLTSDLEVSKGKTFTVKAEPKSIKGKITYKWSVLEGKIVKGQGTKTVTISADGVPGSFVTVSLEANTPANCPVRATKWVTIAKQ